MTAAPRHSWEREAEHRYRCVRCGCLKVNVLRPGRSDTDPGRWVATFERGAERREGLTPPCPGRLPGGAETAPAGAAGGLSHVLNHIPELAAAANCPETPNGSAADPVQALPDPHRGGCWFCGWIRHRDMHCMHKAYRVPTPYMQARESGQPCGSRGALWEARPR